VIDYYTVPALGGNGRKVSIMLAETGLEHVVNFIDLGRGDQHEDWYLAINPNGKIPAIVDHDAPGDLALGESGAILIYLAEKTGQFLPTEAKARACALMWTFWQVGGVGPMFGQWSHFAQAAGEKIPSAITRYRDECRRLLDVLNGNLADKAFVAGDYSIADMALLSWIKPGHKALSGADADAHRWPHVTRWLGAVQARPAVALAMTKPEGAAARIGLGAQPTA
jgi:GST-like protein